MQMIDTEQYIELVRQLGIEAAYEMRFRATGRTVRDTLKLAIMLSEGKTVHLHSANVPGKRRKDCICVMRQVAEVCTYLGMKVRASIDILSYEASGGSIRIVTAQGNELRGMKVPHDLVVYELHSS